MQIKVALWANINVNFVFVFIKEILNIQQNSAWCRQIVPVRGKIKKQMRIFEKRTA